MGFIGFAAVLVLKLKKLDINDSENIKGTMISRKLSKITIDFGSFELQSSKKTSITHAKIIKNALKVNRFSVVESAPTESMTNDSFNLSNAIIRYSLDESGSVSTNSGILYPPTPPKLRPERTKSRDSIGYVSDFDGPIKSFAAKKTKFVHLFHPKYICHTLKVNSL